MRSEQEMLDQLMMRAVEEAFHFGFPLDAGAVLVKDQARLTASFGIKPSYLTDELDRSNERYQYYVHGFEQSRRFRSLKVWMSFKRYGTDQIGEWIDNNVRR